VASRALWGRTTTTRRRISCTGYHTLATDQDAISVSLVSCGRETNEIRRLKTIQSRKGLSWFESQSQSTLCLNSLKGEWYGINLDCYAVLVTAHGASECTSVEAGMCRFDA
jgi:hypothetical protein